MPGVTRRSNRARHAGHRSARLMRNDRCAAVLLAPEVPVTALTTQNNAEGSLLAGFGGGDEPGFSVPPALIVTSSRGIVGNLHYRLCPLNGFIIRIGGPMAPLLVSAAVACLPVREVVRLVRLLPLPDVSVRCSPSTCRSGSSLMTTNSDRVIEALRRSPGLDDDELAREAAVEPKEVNQICRYLEILGRLRRTPGTDGKIVNILIDT